MRKNVDFGEVKRGWPIIAGSTLGMSIGTAALIAPSLGVFFSAIAEDFGWTMREMSALMLPFGLCACVSSIIFGTILDKVGVRPILIFGYILFCVTMVGLVLLPESWPVLLFWIMMLGTAGIATGGMSFARILNEKFDSCRGLALGALTTGVGAVGIAVPVVSALMIGAWGWRGAYGALGILVAVLAPVAMAFVWKASGPPAKKTVSEKKAAETVEHDYGSLLRSKAMWIMVLAVALISFGLNGYLIHIVPMLQGQGFTFVEAALAQSLFAAAMIVSRLGTGAAIDRFFAPYVSAVTCLAAAGGMVIVVMAGGSLPALTFFGVALIGIAYGAEADVLAYIMSRYFGLESFGRAYGLLHGLGILAAGLSPLIIAHFSADGTDYATALYVTAGLLVAGAVTFMCAPPFSQGDRVKSHEDELVDGMVPASVADV